MSRKSESSGMVFDETFEKIKIDREACENEEKQVVARKVQKVGPDLVKSQS